jgi:hypothetical protein
MCSLTSVMVYFSLGHKPQWVNICQRLLNKLLIYKKLISVWSNSFSLFKKTKTCLKMHFIVIVSDLNIKVLKSAVTKAKWSPSFIIQASLSQTTACPTDWFDEISCRWHALLSLTIICRPFRIFLLFHLMHFTLDSQDFKGSLMKSFKSSDSF